MNEPSTWQLSFSYKYIYIFFFIPPPPRRAKIPWLKQHKFIQQLLTVLLFYSCQENLSRHPFLPKCFLRDTWQCSMRKQEAAQRDSDKDTQEMTAPWQPGASWPSVLAPTTQKGFWAQGHTWTGWAYLDWKVVNKLIPALFPLEDIFLNEYFIVLRELHENRMFYFLILKILLPGSKVYTHVYTFMYKCILPSFFSWPHKRKFLAWGHTCTTAVTCCEVTQQ